MSNKVIRLRWLAGVLGSALLLSACGGGSAGEEPGNETATTEDDAMPVQDSAFGEMVGTMDRARSVETTEMERKDAVDRAIDQDSDRAPAE